MKFPANSVAVPVRGAAVPDAVTASVWLATGVAVPSAVVVVPLTLVTPTLTVYSTLFRGTAMEQDSVASRLLGCGWTAHVWVSTTPLTVRETVTV